MKQQTSEEGREECIRAFQELKNITDPQEKKGIISRCILCIKDIPKKAESISGYQLCLELTTGIENPADRKWLLLAIASELPRTTEFTHLYTVVLSHAIRSANDIVDPKARKDALLDVIYDIPQKPDFRPLYTQGMGYAIKAADEISAPQHRIHALLSMAKEIPTAPGYNSLRLKALKLALNLATTVSRPIYEKNRLNDIARTLPKSSDVSFYRQYTLLGIAKEIPKSGEFLGLYKEAVRLAIAAATTIEEPFYRKYALCYIAEDLSTAPESLSLYKHTVMEAFKAASAIVDPLVRIHALIDILKLFPKTADFSPMLRQTLKDILDFYTLRKRIKDITPMEVIDFILFAEEKGVLDSKKAKFTKNK